MPPSTFIAYPTVDIHHQSDTFVTIEEPILTIIMAQSPQFFLSVIFWPCHVASGILVPPPGTESMPLALEGEFSTSGLLGKSSLFLPQGSLFVLYIPWIWTNVWWHVQVHAYVILQRIFTAVKIPCAPPIQPARHTQSLETLILLLSP